MAGKSRFGGTGSQWKTSWRGQAPFSPINFIQNFSTGEIDGDGNPIVNQFYEDGAILDVDSDGWFVGAVVGLQEAPASPQTIAHNGAAGDGWWTLDLIPAAGGARARLRLQAGASAFSVESPVISLSNIDPVVGDPNRIYVAILAGFVSSAIFPANGAAFIHVTPAGGPQPLADPYANPAPALSVGAGNGAALLAPNVLHGLIGGTALWDGTFGQTGATYEAWLAAIREQNQIVPLPDPQGIGIVTTDGWRAPGPVGEAPDPLAPFVGSVSLEYGVATTAVLELGSDQPAVFFPDNLAFPYAGL